MKLTEDLTEDQCRRGRNVRGVRSGRVEFDDERAIEIETALLCRGITTVMFDAQRHLICTPYNVENLHLTATVMGIKRCWFHHDHYDLPKGYATALNAYVNDLTAQGVEGGFIERRTVRQIYKVIHPEVK